MKKHTTTQEALGSLAATAAGDAERQVNEGRRVVAGLRDYAATLTAVATEIEGALAGIEAAASVLLLATGAGVIRRDNEDTEEDAGDANTGTSSDEGVGDDLVRGAGDVGTVTESVTVPGPGPGTEQQWAKVLREVERVAGRAFAMPGAQAVRSNRGRYICAAVLLEVGWPADRIGQLVGLRAGAVPSVAAEGQRIIHSDEWFATRASLLRQQLPKSARLIVKGGHT